MDNTGQLLYNRLSLIYLQLFSVEDFRFDLLDTEHCRRIDRSIDRQIFHTPQQQDRPVERYRLDGFPFHLDLQQPYGICIEGHMFVEMSVFFGHTISLSYRMVLNDEKGYCSKNRPLTTDHLIALAALSMGAEHWNCVRTLDDTDSAGNEAADPLNQEAKTASNINLDISDIDVDSFWIGPAGNKLDKAEPVPIEGAFQEIQRRYKQWILESQRREQKPSLLGRLTGQKPRQYSCEEARDLHYVFIDVWEDVGHTADIFRSMSEPAIVAHIRDNHRCELVGLMSFYPYEWPYRDEESFGDICGGNMAIDTDDLILVNQNMCVVFGTYGLRGEDSPTDWEQHLLERRHYHVCWPEYLMILEMVLARKYTIGHMADIFMRDTLRVSSLKKARDMIEQTARDGLDITVLLLRMDAVKYSRYISHKVMFERTVRRLEVERDSQLLDATIAKVDKSLFNISEIRKLKQATVLNIILGSISIASLFTILFQQLRVPFLEVFDLDETMIRSISFWMIFFTSFLIMGFGITMILLSVKNYKFKK